MKACALIAFWFAAIFSHISLGQDVHALYNEAKAAYKEKNFRNIHREDAGDARTPATSSGVHI